LKTNIEEKELSRKNKTGISATYTAIRTALYPIIGFNVGWFMKSLSLSTEDLYSENTAWRTAIINSTDLTAVLPIIKVSAMAHMNKSLSNTINATDS
jgi:hypothetical protein